MVEIVEDRPPLWVFLLGRRQNLQNPFQMDRLHIHGGGIVLCPHFLDRLEEVRIFSLLGHNSFAATLEHLCGGGYSGRDGGAYALHHQIS